jgi:carboxymethylenebutenolidase
MGRFDVDAGVKDIQMTLAALRMRDDTDGHVGTVGFCLGGLLAYLSACRTNGDAHVGYYGVNIDKHMDEAGAISAPVLLHVAGEDEFVDKEAQAKILDMAEKHQHITAFHYPGRGHAFARVGGAHYHKDDAETADARTLAFFREHLG